MVIKRMMLLALWHIFVGASLFAQARVDSIAEAFQAAEEELVLLKNEEGLVPLQRLDTLRVALLGIGLEEGTVFQQMLEKYMPITTEPIPRLATAAGMSDWLARMKADYNLVIIGIHDHREAQGSYQPVKLALQRLLEQQRSAVVVFGGTNAFQELPWLHKVEVLLFTPSNEYAHSLAAQLLFGGVGASGKLRQAIPPHFRAGTGLFTQNNLRLRYSPPEVVGMHRQLLEDSIRAIVEEGIARRAYPGAQVVVAKDGHVVFQESFGYQTYDSLQMVTMRDIYDYASVTKITGALPALMKLHGEGKFDLDAPMERYFPAFRRSDKDELTFRAMLAHNARLRPWIPYWRGTLRGNAKYPWQKNWDNARLNDFRFRCRTFKQDSSRRFPIRVTDKLWLHRKFKERRIYRSIKKSPLLEEPGYVYSGLLFYLLPEIVQDITDRDFEAYLKEQFYHRLGAYTITYNPLRYFPKDRIVPTERDTFFRMELLQGTVHDEGAAMMGGVSSNAGLFSTANDLAKLMQMYLNEGDYGGEQLIAEASVREFTRYQYPQDSVRRGLGFDKPLLEYKKESSYVAESASPASFGHSGYTGTFTWADPENGLLLVFFSNRVYPTRDNRRLYELDIRPRLHQACYDAIFENY